MGGTRGEEGEAVEEEEEKQLGYTSSKCDSPQKDKRKMTSRGGSRKNINLR